MTNIVIGIDPGLSGAISVYNSHGLSKFFDMPVCAQLTGKGNEINKYALAILISTIIEVYEDANYHAYLEQVNAMRGQGVTSMFKFGRSVGVIEGVLAANEMPITYVRPHAWKNEFGLIKKDKDVSRTMAINLFPSFSEQLKLKKHVGRADAILIGLYGYNKLGEQ